MKKLLCIIYVLIFPVNNFYTQTITSDDLGFNSYSITNKELGEINYYVSKNDSNIEKPILLYLDGSGAFPLFQQMKNGIGSTVIIDFQNLSKKFTIVLISKPNVPFIDSVKTEALIKFPIYHQSKIYKQRLSLNWRVQSANLVLDKMHKINPKNKIIVVGVSEGFQVGTKLISINHDITYALLFVGNGLSQFYDFILQNRIDVNKKLITETQAQKNIDSLYSVFRSIYSDPKATDKEWFGHTYLRWSSFGSNNPTENIMSSKIPIYIVACSNDNNTSVLGTDYLFLESIRLKKKNITYKVYPYNHSFNEYIKDENGQIISVKNHTKEVFNRAFKWLNEKLQMQL